MKRLTHVNPKGEVRMVDVGDKSATQREATARARVHCDRATIAAIRSGHTKKGDVLATVRVAGILAAKRTAELIPLCHTIALSSIDVSIELEKAGAVIEAKVRTTDRTGVEMEALTAVSAAALTFYDMVKSVDRGVSFEVKLVRKSGGRSGDWQLDAAEARKRVRHSR